MNVHEWWEEPPEAPERVSGEDVLWCACYDVPRCPTHMRWYCREEQSEAGMKSTPVV